MQKIYFLYFLSVAFGENTTNLEGNCMLHNVTASHWATSYVNTIVNDTERSIFHSFKANNIKGVNVDGVDFEKYVNVRLEHNAVIVYPSKDFDYYEENEKCSNSPEIAVTLVFNCKNHLIRNLVFNQPIHDENTYTPKFNQTSYVFTLPMPLPPGFNTSGYGQDIVACDWDISNMRLNFSIKFTEHFTIEWLKTTDVKLKCHQAVLKVTKWVWLNYNESFEIIVSDEGEPVKSSLATLEIKIDKNISLPRSPKFEFPYYEARYVHGNGNHQFIIRNPILLINSSPNVQVTIDPVYKEHFSVKLFLNLVCVDLIKKLDDKFLESNLVIFITLEASTKNAESVGKTILAVYVEHAYLSTTEVPTLMFEKESYWFEITIWYCGVIDYIKVTTTPLLDVAYYIKSFDGFPVPKQLTIDRRTGILALTNNLRMGIYRFIVMALEENYQLKAEVNVTINVRKEVRNLQTQNSLMAMHIKENTATTIQLPCRSQNAVCFYTVIDQYPLTHPVLFSSSNGQLHTAAIDREIDEIVNMSIPQFLVHLRLIEQAHLPTKRDVNSREWINIPITVKHEIDQLILSVIIDDINDNPPVFIEGSAVVVGYYYANFSIPLLPYITQVHATDADFGTNADITYTVDNDIVVIHPKTGILSLVNTSFVSDVPIHFVVKAADQNGTGLSSSLTVTVVPLAVENIMLITTNSSLKGILQTVTGNTTATIKVLPSFPYMQTSVTTKYFLYGLDEGNSPLDFVELNRIINQTGISTEQATFPYLPCQPNNDFAATSCLAIRKRLVIAVTTMGVIIITFVVVMFTSSFCRYQKEKNKQSRKTSNKLEEQSMEISISSEGNSHLEDVKNTIDKEAEFKNTNDQSLRD